METFLYIIGSPQFMMIMSMLSGYFFVRDLHRDEVPTPDAKPAFYEEAMAELDAVDVAVKM